MSTTLTDNPAEVDQSADPVPRARSWTSDFFAPYRLIFQPAPSGTSIRDASISATLCTLVFSIPLIVAMIVSLILLDETISHPTRSIDQLWRSLHSGRGPSVFEGVLIIVPVITSAAVVVISLMSLQDVYRDG